MQRWKKKKHLCSVYCSFVRYDFKHVNCCFLQEDAAEPKLHTQLSSTDLFGDDEELSSDEEQVRVTKELKLIVNTEQGCHKKDKTINCKRYAVPVWPVPYTCAQPCHSSRGSHGQLFQPC